jgi:hypothetical protein
MIAPEISLDSKEIELSNTSSSSYTSFEEHQQHQNGEEEGIGEMSMNGDGNSNNNNSTNTVNGNDGVVKVHKGLNLWRLAALTFFTVAGGPYGLEQLVSTGGPLFAILGIVIVPWVSEISYSLFLSFFLSLFLYFFILCLFISLFLYFFISFLYLFVSS